MANIIDYVDKYCNTGFDEKPFNDVDGLVLAQFSYLKMDGIVPGIGSMKESILLRDILYHPDYEKMYSDERYAKDNRTLFEAMVKGKRFGTIELNHHINLVSRRYEMQFSAITCIIPNDIVRIVYRGTDESIIGWKEDFNMAFSTPIPAQIKAVDYLNYVAERSRGKIALLGHSKGGNLAVYAAMKCPKIIRDRVISTHSYDGPGFTKDAINHDDFERIRPIICKLVPHSSLVGMLLQTQEKYKVVSCRSFGLLQHDPFNWIVDDDSFIYEDDINELAELQNRSVNEWAENTDPNDMKIFADRLFDVIAASGIEDLNDFKGNYAEIFRKFTTAMENLDDDEKELIKEIFKSLMMIFIGKVKDQSEKSIKDELDKIGKRNI